jgi:hypothetical protein
MPRDLCRGKYVRIFKALKKFGEREAKFIGDLQNPRCEDILFAARLRGGKSISYRPSASQESENWALHRFQTRCSDWLWAGRPDSNPGRSKNFLFFTKSRPTLGPTQPPIRLVSGALKAAGAWIRPLTSILCGDKELWSYTTTPPYAFMTLLPFGGKWGDPDGGWEKMEKGVKERHRE